MTCCSKETMAQVSDAPTPAIAPPPAPQLMSLLALALRAAPEAAAQLEAHLRLFRHAPLAAPPPAVRSAHAGWLSRQYSRAADLLSSPGVDVKGLRVSAGGEPSGLRLGLRTLVVVLKSFENLKPAFSLIHLRGINHD